MTEAGKGKGRVFKQAVSSGSWPLAVCPWQKVVDPGSGFAPQKVGSRILLFGIDLTGGGNQEFPDALLWRLGRYEKK